MSRGLSDLFKELDNSNDKFDFRPIAITVHKCIEENDLSRLRSTVSSFTKNYRRRIVSQKINGNAPLFTACQQGKVHFANFLLDECDADIEMKGVYVVPEDNSRHLVTPLWCASVAGHLEVVKTLTAHGADINSPSDTDSTPVRSACYMTNYEIIKHLVAQGADIHKPNINGGTCLINSVQDVKLCWFLINHGADINARDNSGNLALHYAIREGRKETVELLLKHGSDYTVQNEFGDDSLQTAALRGHQDIADLIIRNKKLGIEDTIRAYELLGSHFVDEKNNLVEGVTHWKTAMALRYKNKEHPILKQLPAKTNPVYCDLREPSTEEELGKLHDPEEIRIQALLIRERVLGPYHKDTTFGLMYRGAVYADSHHFQRCVDLWKYAYILRHEKCEPLNQECLFTIQALIKLFWEIEVEMEAGASDEPVKAEDALEVLVTLQKQIKAAKDFLKSPKAEASSGSEFQLLMQLILHLMHLLTRIDCSAEQNREFMMTVHQLVVLDPRGTKNESLLHLAVDTSTSMTSEEYYSPFPCFDVIKVLITCGANVSSVSSSGNTPLHDAAIADNDVSILSYLLEKGAHVDMCNARGQTALSLLQRVPSLTFCPMKHVSLRCLAARVIVKHELSYKDEIPVTLVSFVDLHKRPETVEDKKETTNDTASS